MRASCRDVCEEEPKSRPSLRERKPFRGAKGDTHCCASPNFDRRARFFLEAELTGGREHPGIVPVYGLGADFRGGKNTCNRSRPEVSGSPGSRLRSAILMLTRRELRRLVQTAIVRPGWSDERNSPPRRKERQENRPTCVISSFVLVIASSHCALRVFAVGK